MISGVRVLLYQQPRFVISRSVPLEGRLVKNIVALFVTGFAGLCLFSQTAAAQRSGSLQATARVVDSRGATSGLNAAHHLVGRLASTPQTLATVETVLAQVAIRLEPGESSLDRPRKAHVTIHYLRN